MTLQNPSPPSPSSADRSFCLLMYLPRSTPSRAVIATFTLPAFEAAIRERTVRDASAEELAFAMRRRVSAISRHDGRAASICCHVDRDAATLRHRGRTPGPAPKLD